MMKVKYLISFSCLGLALIFFHPAYADTPPDDSDGLPALCTTLEQLQNPAECPQAGPGGYAEQIVAAGLPYPLPPLNIEPILPYRGITPHAYAKIITGTTPVFRHPLEAVAGFPPLRWWEKGFVFVSVIGKTTFAGEDFYQINAGEFMRASDLAEARPSSYSGQYFSAPPVNAVGWAITNVQPSPAPGEPPDPNAAWLGRYSPIEIYATTKVGEWFWYLVGPGQWIEQRTMAKVEPHPSAGASGDSIVVDTYEQTLGVYRGGGLVMATLISSGSRYFPTQTGTFHVWAKFTHGRMTGAYFRDRRDYYFLEDVPWILYYDGDRALHGAYWHDHFGAKSSHGCVNLSPRDAHWLYNNVPLGETVVVFASQ
jgi:L,D-transpeptidase-like protein